MIRTELALRLPNSPGALAGVCRLLSDERVNIVAMSIDPAGQLRLVGHLPLFRRRHRLRDQHFQVAVRDVILLSVPNGPGSLAPALRLVADAGVNVEYAYGGASEGAPMAAIVLGVADAARAASAAGV